MKAENQIKEECEELSNESTSEEDIAPLRCWDCNVNFTSRQYLYSHLFHHIKQPSVYLERVELPPLKLTLKVKPGNNFEIINSPTYTTSPKNSPKISSASNSPNFNLAETTETTSEHSGVGGDDESEQFIEEENGLNVSFSPTLADIEPLGGTDSPQNSEETNSETTNLENLETIDTSVASTPEYGNIPGAEPTPPPEASPDYPKIRIKTTGLLKEPLTITEITDENPEGDPGLARNTESNIWSSSLDDPLKLPSADDSNILSLFNNNERAKDLGFCTSDSEFISMDRLDDRNRGAMQLYNSTSSSQTSLDNLTGLPMQALAQQVSRLQPSGNGMSQQNVLINIQQFPTPPQPSYQPPPPMYPHHPPHPSQPPMYQPYQYQPPAPMYYPPAPNYPPQHMPPPQPPMNQMNQPPQMSQQQINQPPMSQSQMTPPQNQMVPSTQSQSMNQMPQSTSSYRQPLPPRPQGPRQMQPGQRMPMGNRGPMGQRQPMVRHRGPMPRPRAPGMTAIRGAMRPRMPTPQNGHPRVPAPIKRSPEQMQALQAKKKRFDVLTPDKDDDDCQVICMQPKNTDGGLPQIESVQGGTTEPAENSIMHLSDSITLSVRNPPPKTPPPKKSDAKAVANILATRGITVTATAKPKEKESSGQKSPTLPTSINLNGAVSIIPAAKTNGISKNNSNSENLPTVDLTDDSTPPPPSQTNMQQKQKPRAGLPFKCDLCQAQYPNSIGLSKHRQSYHKTTSGMCELGIPLFNLKQPGVLQKLAAMGVQNYIPMTSGTDGPFAMPVMSLRNPGNFSNMNVTSMLSLGPVRNVPKPNLNHTINSNGPGKQQAHK